MAVEITFRSGTVTPTSASGITMGEPAYNTVDNRLFIGKGYGITAAWVGAPISNDYLQIVAGLTQQIPTLGAVKDYVNYIGTIGATGPTGAQGIQGVTGPVGNYVVSFNGLTGAVTGVTAGGANTFTALNSFSAGISAAGGVTFSGTFSGATASFSKLLSASAGVSASDLTVTTTGDEEKTSAITMGYGLTAVTSVESLITLCSYDATSFATQSSIGSNIAAGYDLKIKGSGDTYINILNNTISIGDVGGDLAGAKITFDDTEYVTVNGKLKPDQLVWETQGSVAIPLDPSGHPIHIRHSDGANPPNYDYPFYVNKVGEVTAAKLEINEIIATNLVTTPLLYADSLFATGGGTLYINSDAGYTGSGGGNSITHIGDLAGDNYNTFITVDDAAGNITVSAPNGTVSIIGGLSAAGATFSGNFSGATATFSKLLTASAGISASGATFSGNISAPNIVNSFNGLTGAVAFSNYVVSVNGVTGAIVSVGLTSGKLSQFASTTSAELAGVVSDETGSGGVLVFNSSPSITTALNTASASFNLLNTTATSLFIGSAATTGRIFGYTGNLTATQSVTVAGANTGVGVNKTVNIGTGSGLNGTVTVNVGQAPTEGTGTINLLSNTAVSGTLNASGNISAPNIVNSFNGLTGAVAFAVPLASASVTGVASFGNEFVVSAVGAVGLTSNYVKSVNGLTGAIVSVAVTGSNIFTGLQTMNAGISASSVAAGTITSTGGITFGSAVNFMAFVPQSSATNGGLWIKEGVFQIGGSALLQGSGSVNYSGNTEHLYVYGYQIIDNAAGYQGARTGLTVKGGTGQSVPLFDVTRGGTSAVQVNQNGTLVAAMGLSASGATFSGNISAPNIVNSFNGSTGAVVFSSYVASFNGITGAVTGVTAGGANTFTALNSFSAGISAAGGVTFSGTFSGATASFSKLLSASAGVSASALTVSTTGTANKTSSIIMASGVTASNKVTSQITLSAYNADAFTFPTPVPYTRVGYIEANSDYDLKLRGGGDSCISILNDSISIGDVDGVYAGTKITVNGSGTSVDITGILLAYNGVLTDSVVPTVGLGGGGTLYINCDSGNIGEGGQNSITHIGDQAGMGNNTYITVDDAAGNITVSAPNGTVDLSGVVKANSKVVSTNARGWFL